MVLSDKGILERMRTGEIQVTPFDKELLNPNTLDLRLGNECKVYYDGNYCLDCRSYNHVVDFPISNGKFILEPGELYLFATHEIVNLNSRQICADILGKSSLGRLGVSIHVTAGFIDTGFRGNIVLEVTVVRPVIIYPMMPVAQIRFELLDQPVMNAYGELSKSKYMNQEGIVASKMQDNFKAKL